MKRNRKFDELLAQVPQETKDRINKMMSCNWLVNGDECSIKGVCNPDGCLSWEKYKEEQK